MTTPTQGEHAQTALQPIQRFEVVDCIDSKHVPAVIPNASGPWVRYEDHAAQVAAITAATAQPAAPQGVAYAELPMQFACSGVFPVYSADQMRAFADGTHALRTKSEASREFLERTLAAMEGVIDVADRKTDEFDALRSCVIDLTLMLFSDAKRHTKGACHER